MTKTFAERCHIAQQFLPDAQYRAMLTKLHAEMLAALAEQPAPVQGWKLVPLQPTAEMVRAYDEAQYSDDLTVEATNVWVAMLGATPQAQPAQPLPAGFIDAVVEAAAILGAVDPDHAPKNMRWPLADELDGFVGMINAAPQAQPAREWVGLTEADMKTPDMGKYVYLSEDWIDGCKTGMENAAAKLKEKNA